MGQFIALFSSRLLQLFSYFRGALVTNIFQLLLIDRYILAILQITFGAFVTLFLIYRDLLNCLRSVGTMVIRSLIINNLFIMTCPHCNFWTPGSGRKGPVNQGPSFRPSLEVFLGLTHQFFLKLSMVLGAHVLLCVTGPDFFKKIFLSQKWRKWAKNEPKTGFFEFTGKFSHHFF